MIHRRRTFQIAPGRQADAITLLHEFNSLDKDIGNIGLRVSVVTTGTLGRIYHHADLESMAAFETAEATFWADPRVQSPGRKLDQGRRDGTSPLVAGTFHEEIWRDT